MLPSVAHQRFGLVLLGNCGNPTTDLGMNISWTFHLFNYPVNAIHNMHDDGNKLKFGWLPTHKICSWKINELEEFEEILQKRQQRAKFFF